MNQNIEVLTWREVREEVKSVNPNLTTILDKMNLGEQDIFYLGFDQLCRETKSRNRN